MLYLAENLKKHRMAKALTQEEVANCLNITPQSVSKWERGETYPDITFLPALANLLDISTDQLIGMDAIRASDAKWRVHSEATRHMQGGAPTEAEAVYREALRTYPNDAGMLLGLAAALALKGEAEEPIDLIERGLPRSADEKQKATMRAALCFLYAKNGRPEKAARLAAQLPHARESREAILPLLAAPPGGEELERALQIILLGEDKSS